MNTDYSPIACGFHDRLEHHAIRRTPVEVVWREGDAEHRATTTVDDVFARDRADWVQLGVGTTVRADALVSLDGIALPPAC
jgi:Rho-binding antiterminator